MHSVHAALADTTAWSALLGLFTPYLVALVNQPSWPRQVRTGVAIAVSVVVGVATSAANGTFTHPLSTFGSVAIVLAASQAAYGRLFPAAVAAVERLTALRAGRQARQHGDHESGRQRDDDAPIAA